MEKLKIDRARTNMMKTTNNLSKVFLSMVFLNNGGLK